MSLEKRSVKPQQILTHHEPHTANHASKLNWLRAAVLGANDGIVSIAGLVVGVASASTSEAVILTAGVAGIIAGAISMAAGEYVSVSSARDTEKALLKRERQELKEFPEEELEELIQIYQKKGLSRKTAVVAAKELSSKDAFAAHVDAELGINPSQLTNPWHAAFASASAFLVGATIPLIAIMLPSATYRIPITFMAVLASLATTGIVSAKVGGANSTRAALRVVTGGAIAMAVTYTAGSLFQFG